MLEGYGLHQLTWDTCDERFGDVLVASPADAGGRGISLAVRQNGAAANLTGATVYFVWKHKATGKRGTEPFSAVDASAGTFEVYYPSAMQEAEGAVQAQVMVSRGDGTYISSRVEPVITVADGRVSSRSVRFKEQLGSWKGLRFTYGKNMAGCMRTVLEQDVYTALYGFGAGLPVTDEDGRYTRRPASKPS